MASIYKRRSKDKKSFSWRAVIRLKGYPVVCNHFDRKQEAEDWAKDTERRIKQGQFNFEAKSRQFTYSDLMKRVQLDGILDHHRSRKNVQSQFDYWNKRLGAYALVHITPELIGEERQLLIESIAKRGKSAANSTINRYIATLSTILSHGVKKLRWIQENPCSRISKLKEEGKRDRILTDEGVRRLLIACKQSKSPYLYCIVLIALTTGARRGEILGLKWKDVDLDQVTLPLSLVH